MSKHDHAPTCNHQKMSYCSKCDVAYCESCNKEWRQYPTYTWNQPYTAYGNGYSPNYQILCNANGTPEGSKTACEHGA